MEKRKDLPLSGNFWSFSEPYDASKKETKHWVWAAILVAIVVTIVVLPRFL